MDLLPSVSRKIRKLGRNGRMKDTKKVEMPGAYTNYINGYTGVECQNLN